MLHQIHITLFKGIPLFNVHTQRQPPGQKIAAQCHTFLTIFLDPGIGSFQSDLGI